jgi:16S rRNA processing protein RimM
MLAGDAWVALGAVARPHGVRGELRVQPFNRDSELLLAVDEVLVRGRDGAEHEVSVDAARRANDAILMKLYSVDDRAGADALRGALICVRRGGFPALAEGEFYVCDLQGARVVVVDGEVPEWELGRVRELRTYPTVDTILVDAKDGGSPWEAPLVDSVVRSIDVQANLVVLATMHGVERG